MEPEICFDHFVVLALGLNHSFCRGGGFDWSDCSYKHLFQLLHVNWKRDPKPGKLSQKARCDKPLSMIFFATSGNTPQGCPKECYCFRNQGYRSILFWNGSPMEVVILSPFCYAGDICLILFLVVLVAVQTRPVLSRR